MPIFASLLVGCFAQVAVFFAQWFGVRTAMGMAAVAVYSGLVVALLAFLKATIAAIVPVIGETNFGVGLGLAFPPNASACLTAWFTVWAACNLFTWKSRALNLMKP